MNTFRRRAISVSVILVLILAMAGLSPAAPPGGPIPPGGMQPTGAVVGPGGQPAPAPAAPATPPPAATPPAAPEVPAVMEPVPVGKPVANVTDDMVRRAIEQGREFLINQQKADGSWGQHAGESALVFMTLAYMEEHPNREVMAKGMEYLLNQNPNMSFGDRQGYGVPIRIMGFSYIQKRLLGDKRAQVRQKMMEDLMLLKTAQTAQGGWRYKLDASSYDFSVSQWPILAMREANLVGVEFALDPLLKARELYYKGQHDDGGWGYTAAPPTPDKPSYGSMTAAGLASVFIISDVLDPASGCPCTNGQSQLVQSEAERRIDNALLWLSKNFKADENPGKAGGTNLYWLYCVERVGIAAGYKYFGDHNWYREGAERLVGQQGGGQWGGLVNTCFSLLFLYKGRAPVLFNKLKFDGVWNAHRRDIANLTSYIEKLKEQQFHWQIVELKSPLEELHDAPVLFISAESLPKLSNTTRPGFSAADKQKLRAFTNTGGTILLEASCGNPAMRRGMADLIRDVWPEWKLVKLPPDHGCFKSVYDLKEKPEILGVDDGIRTAVFYSPDDISCPWHMKAITAKGYLFNWGINLYTYATDGAPLRAKLTDNELQKSDRYKNPVKAGPKTTLKIARVKHGGNWGVGANYGVFTKLAEIAKTRAAVTLDLKESGSPSPAEYGTAIADLADCPIAYLAGSTALLLKPEEKEALKAYVAKGGLVWLEAVTGAPVFDQSVRQLAADMKWDLRLIPANHPLMTGRMDPALGYNLTAGVEFKPALKILRMNRPFAELVGVYEGERLIGLYSPLDVLYSLTGYEAFRCRGYRAPDAAAVATNILLYLSTK